MSDKTYSEAYESLKEEFLLELPEKIGIIEAHILAIDEAGTFSNLVAATHSLKGAASTYGFNIITTICHQMEDVLTDIGDTKAKIGQAKVDLLLKYVDLMVTAITDIQSREHNFDPILHNLDALRAIDNDDRLRILIVEPSSLYNQLINQNLITLPVRVTTVKDGYRALEYLLFQKFDLLITGMETPPLNADALISALRITHGRNQQIQTILTTTYHAKDVKNAHYFDQILDRKAINNNNLLNVVSNIIENT